MCQIKVGLMLAIALGVAVTGCTSAARRNYTKNIEFYRSCLSVSDATRRRDLHRIDYDHLRRIDVVDLDAPVLYYAYVDPAEIELARVGKRSDAEIHVRWSENAFHAYHLVVRTGDSPTEQLPPVFSSDQAKSLQRAEDFEFLVHYAMYGLPSSVVGQVDRAVEHGAPVALALVSSNGVSASGWFPWQQVERY